MPENAMLTCLGAGAAGIATLDLLCELGFQMTATRLFLIV
jgi:malic enzyme